MANIVRWVEKGLLLMNDLATKLMWGIDDTCLKEAKYLKKQAHDYLTEKASANLLNASSNGETHDPGVPIKPP